MITAFYWMLYICGGIVAILFVIYIYLLSQKAIDNAKKRRLAVRRERLEPLVLSYLKEGESYRSIYHGDVDDLKVLKDVMHEYSQLVSSVDQQGRVQELAARIFTEPFRKMMRARRYSTRMNTLFAIEELRIYTLRYDVQERLETPNLEPLEVHQLYRIMAVLDPDELLEMLVDPNREPLPNFMYRELLLKIDEEMFWTFVERMDGFPPLLRLCVIDIIGNKRDFRYLDTLDHLLDSEQAEERIRALKALARIGYVRDSQHLIQRATAESWPERMMAVKAMGAIAREEFISVLQNAMRDSSWWVRTASAQGLLRYPNGPQILRTIAETDEDRFARDMAREWLEARQ